MAHYIKPAIQRAAPYVTLTVITSFALNRAMLARVRKDEATQHTLQLSFLQTLLSTPSSSLTDEEALRLSRSARAIGLDPTALALPAVPGGPREMKETSWKSIFWGDGDKASEGFKRTADKVGAMLRQGGFETKSEEQKERERKEEEESVGDAEWFKEWAEPNASTPVVAPPSVASTEALSPLSSSPVTTSQAELPARSIPKEPVAPASAPPAPAPAPSSLESKAPTTPQPKPQRRIFV